MAQRATRHIEHRQADSPSTSPAASPASSRTPVPLSRADSANWVSQGVTLEVALKTIRRRSREIRKACGERCGCIRALRACPPLFPLLIGDLTHICMRCSSVVIAEILLQKGRILQVVRVEVNVLSCFRARNRNRANQPRGHFTKRDASGPFLDFSYSNIYSVFNALIYPQFFAIDLFCLVFLP